MTDRTPRGLTTREAGRRLAQYGPNEVSRWRPGAGPGARARRAGDHGEAAAAARVRDHRALDAGPRFACRTTSASLRRIGVLTNRPLLRGVAFEICFAAGIIYLPPLRSLFHTAALDPAQLALLATFPFLVWGTDEAWRGWRRHHPGCGEATLGLLPNTDDRRPPGWCDGGTTQPTHQETRAWQRSRNRCRGGFELAQAEGT